MKKDTFRVAFCGLISALALVLMLITGLFPFGTYALPCFSGFLLTAVVIEFGARWAYAAYGVVAVLSLILAGDKEAAVYFIALFGFYPIVKATIERLKSKPLQYIIKFAVFNVCVIGAFFVCKLVLMIPDEEFTIFGVYVPWVFLIIGEVFFFLYDRCTTVLVSYYIFKIRDKIFKP